MKGLFSLILAVSIMISCSEPVRPPSEKEVAALVAKCYSSLPGLCGVSIAGHEMQMNGQREVKSIKLLSLKRNPDSDDSFDAVVVSEGIVIRGGITTPSIRDRYIDTVSLEVKAHKGEWIGKKIIHNASYTPLDDPHTTQTQF